MNTNNTQAASSAQPGQSIVTREAARLLGLGNSSFAIVRYRSDDGRELVCSDDELRHFLRTEEEHLNMSFLRREGDVDVITATAFGRFVTYLQGCEAFNPAAALAGNSATHFTTSGYLVIKAHGGQLSVRVNDGETLTEAATRLKTDLTAQVALAERQIARLGAFLNGETESNPEALR